MEQAAELNNLTFGVPSKGWALHGSTNWGPSVTTPAEAGQPVVTLKFLVL